MATKTIFSKRKEDLDRHAVRLIRDAIAKVLIRKDHVVLGVAGGRSVAGIFDLLAMEQGIEWGKVHIFLVDDRVVPITHEESNYRLAHEHFIAALIKKRVLPSRNAHPFIADFKKRDFGVEAYTRELSRFGGAFDIALVSMGEDGHMGGLYPHHHSVMNESEGFIHMHDSPKPPPQRMSMSRGLFLRTHTAILLVIGEAKRKSYKVFRNATTAPEQCPSKLVQKIADAYVLTDLE